MCPRSLPTNVQFKVPLHSMVLASGVARPVVGVAEVRLRGEKVGQVRRHRLRHRVTADLAIDAEYHGEERAQRRRRGTGVAPRRWHPLRDTCNQFDERLDGDVAESVVDGAAVRPGLVARGPHSPPLALLGGKVPALSEHEHVLVVGRPEHCAHPQPRCTADAPTEALDDAVLVGDVREQGWRHAPGGEVAMRHDGCEMRRLPLHPDAARRRRHRDTNAGERPQWFVARPCPLPHDLGQRGDVVPDGAEVGFELRDHPAEPLHATHNQVAQVIELHLQQLRLPGPLLLVIGALHSALCLCQLFLQHLHLGLPLLRHVVDLRLQGADEAFPQLQQSVVR
eukprot:PhM_4_TR9387/c0_g1_i1/m.11295